MTDDRTPRDDLPALAAEHALGLLDGEDLARALGLVRSDPAFRAEVERWRGRLGPMLDEIDPVTPPAGLWSRIERAIGRSAEPSNVVPLQRKLAMWRGVAAAMTALAACLILFVLLRPTVPVPVTIPVTAPPQVASAPMVARLNAGQKVALVASWDSQRRQLLLATAAGLPSRPSHSHQLWVIPADGKPRSLGVMAEKDQMMMPLPAPLGELMRSGATIAVSVEPMGGSPTGAPTGPVVASGILQSA